jgi:hypothetical protein
VVVVISAVVVVRSGPSVVVESFDVVVGDVVLVEVAVVDDVVDVIVDSRVGNVCAMEEPAPSPHPGSQSSSNNDVTYKDRLFTC